MEKTCKLHKTQYADFLVCDCTYYNTVDFWQPTASGYQLYKPRYCPNCGCKIDYEITEIPEMKNRPLSVKPSYAIEENE